MQVAAARDVKPSHIALAWLLSKPAVAAPVIGATRHEHITDAARACELELTPEEIAGLEEKYTPIAPVYG